MKHINMLFEIFQTIINSIKPINISSIIDKAESELKRKHFLVEVIEKILQTATEVKHPFALKDGFLYVYNGAYWIKCDNPTIKRFLGLAANKMGVNKYYSDHHEFRTELIKQMFEIVDLLESHKNNKVRINLLNGTLALTDNLDLELRDFDHRRSFTYQLQFTYARNEGCPTFQSFLDRVLPDKSQQQILSEYIGYVFLNHDYLKLEKCMVLFGSGANGKSVFYEITSALLGPHNISSYNLQALTNTAGYYRAHLANKLLNYGSEISAHMDPELFKQLVSGEPVGARLPYREPFELENYAKLMFNANTLPSEIDQNDAYFRRFLIVNFAVTIPEEERDPELAKKIINTELPGVFNWVMYGLIRLINNKKFTFSEAVENNNKEYRSSSDSVTLFLKDENYKTSDEKSVALKSFNDEYRRYCSSSGYKAISRVEFTRRLRKFGLNVSRKNYGYAVDVEKKV